MGANTNSVSAYSDVKAEELQEAAGVTQFPSSTGWYQLVNGLQIQGGRISILSGANQTVPFHAPYEKQVLGVFLQVLEGAENGAYIDPIPALDEFTVYNGVGDRFYYWWAIGV
jgi:hypothetical protein